MAFANAQHVSVNSSNFTDVAGSQTIINTTILQDAKSGTIGYILRPHMPLNIFIW